MTLQNKSENFYTRGQRSNGELGGEHVFPARSMQLFTGQMLESGVEVDKDPSLIERADRSAGQIPTLQPKPKGSGRRLPRPVIAAESCLRRGS
jgi:hypothetical protein